MMTLGLYRAFLPSYDEKVEIWLGATDADDVQTLKYRATHLLRRRSGGPLVLTQSLFVLVLATCERTDTEE